MRKLLPVALLLPVMLTRCAASDHVIGTDVVDAGMGGKDAGRGSGGRPDAGRSASSGGAPASNPDAAPSSGGGASGQDAGPLEPLDPAQIPPPGPNAVVTPNVDSAVINVDAVDGAKDYRAFIVKNGVDVLTDSLGREVVNGATIFCAGQRQHAAPKLPVAEVMQQIEVTDSEASLLDDLLQQAPRVHFDFYVSRQRVIMYVNGLFYLENTLFADEHTWDNVGFEEGVNLPASYTDSDCYTYTP